MPVDDEGGIHNESPDNLILMLDSELRDGRDANLQIYLRAHPVLGHVLP